MLPYLVPRFFQQDKGAEKVRHEFLKVPLGATPHLFAGPIRKCYLNVLARKSPITTEKIVPEPANCLPQAKDPTQRKMSKQPTDRAVDQINDVIADFTECLPKVAHSNTELTSRLGEYSTQINAGSGDARGEPYRRIGVSASDERSAFTVRRRSRKRSVLLCFFKA